MNQQACECKDCGHYFNAKISDGDPVCPQCKSKNVEVVDIAF